MTFFGKKSIQVSIAILIAIFLLLLKNPFCRNNSLITIDIPTQDERKKIIQAYFDEWDWLMDYPLTEKTRKNSRIEENVIDEIYSFSGIKCRCTIRVIHENGVYAGFIIYHPVEINKEKLGRIGLLHIEKDFRRKGFGTILTKYALSDFFENQKVERVFLLTKDSNIRAKKMYEKIGFSLANSDYQSEESDESMQLPEDYKCYYVITKDTYKDQLSRQ